MYGGQSEASVRAQGVLLRVAALVIGARVTSWQRSAAENTRVGGHPQSYHLVGGAVDVGAESTAEQRAFLRKFAKEVDETTPGMVSAHGGGAGSTGGHWHYQVDGRSLPVLAAFSAIVVGAVGIGWLRVEQGGNN